MSIALEPTDDDVAAFLAEHAEKAVNDSGVPTFESMVYYWLQHYRARLKQEREGRMRPDRDAFLFTDTWGATWRVQPTDDRDDPLRISREQP